MCPQTAVPDSLLNCRPAPQMTPLPQATQKDAAEAMTGFALAWEDCSEALAQVRALLRPVP